MGTATSKPAVWHVTSVKLSPEEHADLKRIAAAEKRSLSNQLRYLIQQAAREMDTAAREAA